MRTVLLSPDLQKMRMDIELSGDLRQSTFSISYSADRIAPSALRRRYRCPGNRAELSARTNYLAGARSRKRSK